MINELESEIEISNNLDFEEISDELKIEEEVINKSENEDIAICELDIKNKTIIEE